jgi:hypothetical protein
MGDHASKARRGTNTLITEAMLADQLDDVLNRIKNNGERFDVQRHGMTIATLAPVNRPIGITAEEVIAKVGNLKVPEGFGDELEAAHTAQGLAGFPDWPVDEE